MAFFNERTARTWNLFHALSRANDRPTDQKRPRTKKRPSRSRVRSFVRSPLRGARDDRPGVVKDCGSLTESFRENAFRSESESLPFSRVITRWFSQVYFSILHERDATRHTQRRARVIPTTTLIDDERVILSASSCLPSHPRRRSRRRPNAAASDECVH